MPVRIFLTDLLPGLGARSDARDVQRVERQAADLRALVVAGDAVLLEERGFSGTGAAWLHRGGCCAAEAEPRCTSVRSTSAADGAALRTITASSTMKRTLADRENVMRVFVTVALRVVLPSAA